MATNNIGTVSKKVSTEPEAEIKSATEVLDKPELDMEATFSGADALNYATQYLMNSYYNGQVNHLSRGVTMDFTEAKPDLLELKLSRQEKMKSGMVITHAQTFQIKTKNTSLYHIFSAADEAFQKFAEA